LATHKTSTLKPSGKPMGLQKAVDLPIQGNYRVVGGH